MLLLVMSAAVQWCGILILTINIYHILYDELQCVCQSVMSLFGFNLPPSSYYYVLLSWYPESISIYPLQSSKEDFRDK